ncbi:MAG: phosphate/phosphite/phosphonate ABC transporter substrate-binding protein [Holophagales bacterium]|nr:phosphate/phosphite/phosphonate ABC transporter substrate-binding protein [Holophagales bacterium]
MSTATAETLVVHLPSSPAESAGRQAMAIDALADALGRAVPGLETRIFRRLSDLREYLDASPEEVSLVLTDAALPATAPDSWSLRPLAGLLIDGRTTYRRLVVTSGSSPAERLSDLRGQPLAVVAAAVGDPADYLGRFVFAGLLDPADYFGRLETTTDDGEAVTALLFGGGHPVLVAEFHPLVRRHLGDGLRAIFESAPLPTPVLSERAGALDDDQRRALVEVLGGLDADGPRPEVAEGLGIDGFRVLDDTARRALVSGPLAAGKRFEPLWPPAGTESLPGLEMPAPPAASELPLTLTLPLSATSPEGGR